MYMINRSAAVVKPRQSFVDWLMTCPDPPDPLSVKDEVSKDCNVYLLAEFDAEEESADAFLETFYSMIAEAEFREWYTDEDLWPDVSDIAAFKTMFDVEVYPMVFDLFKDKIRQDQY